MGMQQPGLRALSLTERQLIEGEHARLERFLRELRETCCEFDSLEECQDCGREKIASCQGRLISFTHDFLDFVIEHFENEEKIMSEIYSTQQSNRYFQLHQQEHMKLVREMESLMHELSVMSRRGHTAIAIREFYYRVAEIFSKHARTLDDPLMQLPEPQN
jgi:hemerythrin